MNLTTHKIMKYYLRFHEAMLLLEVGYPRVTHPFAAIQRYIKKNQPKLHSPSIARIARLACLIHAASVHSEPGSNPPKAFFNCGFFQRTRRHKKSILKDAFPLLHICFSFSKRLILAHSENALVNKAYYLYTKQNFCQVLFK